MAHSNRTLWVVQETTPGDGVRRPVAAYNDLQEAEEEVAYLRQTRSENTYDIDAYVNVKLREA